MFVLFLLIGSALGVAGGHEKQSHNKYRGLRVAAFLFCAFGWVTIAAAFVFPIIQAEQFAFEGDEAIRSAPADPPTAIAAQYAIAADRFHSALENVPYNADYAFRCAKAKMGAGDFAEGEKMIIATQQLNPRLIDAYLLQANLELRTANPRAAVVCSDFDTALQLDPNDVSMHTQYGDALDRLRLPVDAVAQYQLALSCNAALPPGEPKRLSPQQLADLQARIQADRSR